MELTSGVLQQAWFTRVWVLQELVFSKDPWIQVGTGRVRRDEVSKCVKSIEASLSISRFIGMHTSRTEYRARILGIENASSTSSTEYARTLFRMLIERRGYGASDPRDMIFANLSCCAGDHLAADYSKTMKQVYEETTACILKHTHDLSIQTILEHAEEVKPGSHRSMLASWCPDCKYGNDIFTS